MREDQADQIIDLLSVIAFDRKTLREDFEKFTGYGIDNAEAIANRIVDGVSGSIAGIGGSTLVDIKMAIEDQ